MPLFSTVISRLLVEVIAIYVKHSPFQVLERFEHTTLNDAFAIQNNLTLHAAFHNNGNEAANLSPSSCRELKGLNHPGESPDRGGQCGTHTI